MLSPAPLWKYRYTKSSSMHENFLGLFPFLTPDYIAEVHFCLNCRTGEPLWEETEYEQRTTFKVVGLHENLIVVQGLNFNQQPLGLWRIDLRSGAPRIPTYPDTFWGRVKQRRAQKHWWNIGDGYIPHGPINTDGTMQTECGLLDIKSLTLLTKEFTFYRSKPKLTPLQWLTKTHRLDLRPLGTLRYCDNKEPKDKNYEPNFSLDASMVEPSFWLEDENGKPLWKFDLAEATRTKRPKNVELHLRLPYLLILLYWPIDHRKEPEFEEPGSYQIWMLDLRTGEIIQRLKPIEEGFVGRIVCDDKGVLFYANVRISGQHGCEFVYYPFSEPGEDTVLGASDDR